MLTKHIEIKLDGNCTRILEALLNKFWKQHPPKQQLYGLLPLISKTIQIRWTRHEGHCWRYKNELSSNVLLWTPSHRHASVGWPTRTYLQQLCTDTGCSLEDLPKVIDDRNGERESGKPVLAGWHDDDLLSIQKKFFYSGNLFNLKLIHIFKRELDGGVEVFFLVVVGWGSSLLHKYNGKMAWLSVISMIHKLCALCFNFS